MWGRAGGELEAGIFMRALLHAGLGFCVLFGARKPLRGQDTGIEERSYALFVAPVLLFASYLFGRPMNLEFTIPEVVAVIG